MAQIAENGSPGTFLESLVHFETDAVKFFGGRLSSVPQKSFRAYKQDRTVPGESNVLSVPWFLDAGYRILDFWM